MRRTRSHAGFAAALAGVALVMAAGASPAPAAAQTAALGCETVRSGRHILRRCAETDAAGAVTMRVVSSRLAGPGELAPAPPRAAAPAESANAVGAAPVAIDAAPRDLRPPRRLAPRGHGGDRKARVSPFIYPRVGGRSGVRVGLGVGIGVGFD